MAHQKVSKENNFIVNTINNGTNGIEDSTKLNVIKYIRRNGGLSCHPAASWHSFVVEPMLVNMMRTKEKAVLNEEKFENDYAYGPDVEALWYLSLKVKIKKKKSTTLPPPPSTTDDSEPGPCGVLELLSSTF